MFPDNARKEVAKGGLRLNRNVREFEALNGLRVPSGLFG
jgi:hypothetical protein